MRARFAGGVQPDPRKAATERLPIVALPAPALAVIPLQQHLGPKSRALVKAGDAVLLGQKIGEAEGFVAANVHASVAGKVKEISLQPHPSGTAVEAVVIENDGTDAPASCEVRLGPFGKTQAEGAKVFEALLKEGRNLESRTRKFAEARVGSVTGRLEKAATKATARATATWDKLEQVFEDRVARALNRLGVPTNRDIQNLSKRVEELRQRASSRQRARERGEAPAACGEEVAARPPMRPSFSCRVECDVRDPRR